MKYIWIKSVAIAVDAIETMEYNLEYQSLEIRTISGRLLRLPVIDKNDAETKIIKIWGSNCDEL